ncbi:MAG: serine/threonine-protein phosphatase [Cyanobacteria bacterium SBLK]|nr:serine/threonine-protein phosphatase [Cyanobacteria bacterium SBLK]
MANSGVILHCSQSDCQAANPESHQFCSACNTPLIRHYLRTIGGEIDRKPGELISDRYLLIRPCIVLDTKPALPPNFPEEPPEELLPYLRLFSQRLHVPQIYGRLFPEETTPKATWLLEYGTPLNARQCKNGQIFPLLRDLWRQSTALRQLNWLWQMAKLWQPLQEEKVASSLLYPSLLGVRGSLLKLLELQRDTEPVSLTRLGELWLSWVSDASPLIRKFLRELCDRVIAGEIGESVRIVALLDYAIAQCSKSRRCRHQIFARTDTGKLRSHNEDACYPPDGQGLDSAKGEWPLAIVCDGIGGHDGGEVASHLAISGIRKELPSLFDPQNKPVGPNAIAQFLENTILNVNDTIGDRNDKERRRDKRRMGTTMVMAVARNQHMFFTHVGDSRIYWITRDSCHQITVDDDIASREVRLGYALYRDALTFPSGGALIQALGMSASTRLYPALDRLVLDEDCLFLLCSDGLSDRDRVEQYWHGEIAPILTGEKKVKDVCDRLIDLANEKNGHDNVTVALIHCQIVPSTASGSNIINYPQGRENSKPQPSPVNTEVAPAQMEKRDKSSRSLFVGSFFILLFLLGGASVLSYFLFPEVRQQTNRLLGNTPVASNSTSVEIPTPSPGANSLDWETLKIGDGIWVKEAIALPVSAIEPEETALEFVQISPQTVLKVIGKKESADGAMWLKVQVCPSNPRKTEENDGEIQLPAPPEELENSQNDRERTQTQEAWFRVDIDPGFEVQPIDPSCH